MSGNHSHNGPAHESTDASFKKAMWIIPLSMVFLVAFVALCWFGATKTLKHEINSKQVAGSADSTAPGSGTP